MNVTWSPRALAQLRDSHAYIRNDNLPAARAFLEAVVSLVQRLAEYPGMGLATDEKGIIVFPLVRYRYLVFYTILSADEIRIVRIRHMSRKN